MRSKNKFSSNKYNKNQIQDLYFLKITKIHKEVLTKKALIKLISTLDSLISFRSFKGNQEQLN